MPEFQATAPLPTGLPPCKGLASHRPQICGIRCSDRGASQQVVPLFVGQSVLLL
jgi:hypothetical protein